ncbi:MAG TPA: nitrile hydratase accessory protein [Acidimicrobiia bacterium]|jgi:nitrile hydratase accessory protein
MRTDTTELGDARRRVEQLLTELPGPGPGGPGVSPEGRADELSFNEPWELRAFAVAVAAYHRGLYDWSEFQLALIGAIRRWEGDPASAPWRYYDRWLEALETVLSGTGVLTGSELDGRASAVLATPRAANHHHARREPVAVDPAR